MNIRMIIVGKINEKYIQESINEFYCLLDMVEIDDSNSKAHLNTPKGIKICNFTRLKSN